MSDHEEVDLVSDDHCVVFHRWEGVLTAQLGEPGLENRIRWRGLEDLAVECPACRRRPGDVRSPGLQYDVEVVSSPSGVTHITVTR